MRLSEVFKQPHLKHPDLSIFLRPASGQPPLDVSKLEIEALVADERRKLKTPVEGTGSIVIAYKGHEGGVASINEKDDGDVWDVCQVQGGNGKKAYRIATSLQWQRALGTQIGRYVQHPEARVRHVTMPPLARIKNIDGARSESIEATYGIVRNSLGMVFSEELGIFVVDIRR